MKRCNECSKQYSQMNKNPEGGCTPPVIQINNDPGCVLFHKVVFPASIGDDTTNPPSEFIGKYKNVLLVYEANNRSYMFSSDGMYTQLNNGITDYEEATNLPQINGNTLIGDKTGAELGLQNELTAGANIQIDSDNVISATDTTYGPATNESIGLVKPGDGLSVQADGTLDIADIEEYAHFFDTVADMKAADNLIDGSYARTLGYYAKNDGGGALYKIRAITNDDVVDEASIIEMGDGSNNLIAELIIEDVINVLQFGAYADGTTATSSAIQKALNFGASHNKTIFIPDGTYLLNTTLNYAPSNNLTLKLGSKAKLTANSNIGSLIDITSSASFFRIEGGIFDGNQVVDYGIRSLYTTNKYSPTYQNICFYDFATSSMIMRDSTHSGQSEHGYILGCKFYNQHTLATCLSIYTHDYTIDDCELFYTNTGIITTGFLVISNTHIWAGGAENTNNNTIGILYSGDRLIASNMYFDGMNKCIDTGGTNKNIFLSNATCLYPNEGTYSNPCVIRNGVGARSFVSNIDIKAIKAQVQLIRYYNFDMGNLDCTLTSVGNVFNEFSNNYSYNYDLIDWGKNIFADFNKSKSIYKGYTQTLTNNKYYQIGYIVLRSSSVTGFDITFTSDDVNKYNQRLVCSLYNSSGTTVSVNSHISSYIGEVGRIGIAVGVAKSVSDGEHTFNACPIYLHIVDNPGNGFGISATVNSVTNGNCVVFNPQYKFNATAIDSPSVLFDDVTNS